MTDGTKDDKGGEAKTGDDKGETKDGSLFDAGSRAKEAETKDGKSEETKDGRPAWIPEKFWNAEDAKAATTAEARTAAAAAALQKSYAELEAAHGKLKREKTPAAPEKPEEYELTAPETAKNFTVQGDDPLLAGYRDTVHKLGLSKEQASGVYQWFAQSMSDVSPEPFDMKGEMDKLGPNAQAVIDDVVGRALQFKEWGVFSDSDVEEYRIAVGTAAGMQMMQKVFQHFGEKVVPGKVQPSSTALPSRTELDAMKWAIIETGPQKGQVKYNVDPDYRAHIDQLFDRVYGSEPAGSSRRVA